MRKSGIAVVAAGALLLAACGSSGPSKSATNATPVAASRKVVLTSIRTTAAAETARIEMTMKLGDNVATVAEGAIDFGSGDSRLTMQFDGPVGTVMGDDGFETRSVDGTVYMRLPSSLPFELPDGKSWIALDASSGDNGLGSPIGIGSQSDPSKALAYLETVSDDVQAVGSEEIRGVDTTHYAATLDLGKSIDAHAADLPAGLRDSMKEIAGMLGRVPADVWIDGDGRLRREQIQLDPAQMFRGRNAGSESGTVVTQTLDLYDFGAPVSVEAPPADQVASLGDITNGGIVGRALNSLSSG